MADHELGAPLGRLGDGSTVGELAGAVSDAQLVAERVEPEVAPARVPGFDRPDDALGMAGEDLDDASEGVGAVERRARPAQDLHPVDELHGQIQRRIAAEDVVDALTVDHHQQLGRVRRAPERHPVIAERGPADIDSGGRPQHVEQRPRAHCGNLAAIDHRHHRGRRIRALRPQVGRDRLLLGLQQCQRVLDALLLRRAGARLRRGGRGAKERGGQESQGMTAQQEPSTRAAW